MILLDLGVPDSLPQNHHRRQGVFLEAERQRYKLILVAPESVDRAFEGILSFDHDNGHTAYLRDISIIRVPQNQDYRRRHPHSPEKAGRELSTSSL